MIDKNSRLHLALLLVVLVVCIWSLIKPFEYFTWILEAAPALAGIAIFVALYKRFRFTNLVYILVAVHCCILLTGAKYSYAEMPLFNWLRDEFGFARNNYDKVGHFAQGFMPAMIIREVFIRKEIVKRSGWLFFIVTCVALAFSAFYEFIEWWVSLAVGSAGDAFLGTQGYVWDTQSDMFCALTGAILSQLLFSKLHDRQLQNLK